MIDPVSRCEAAERGLTFYYTAENCIAGHDSKRYTSSGGCVMCSELRERAPKKPSLLVSHSNVRQRANDIELARELAEIEAEHKL